MNNPQDWRYEPKRMVLREQALSVLLKTFGSDLKEDGSPVYSTESIYECAHDWVSQGNPRTDGIVKYYKAYYLR
jgi:hypothetical protein